MKRNKLSLRLLKYEPSVSLHHKLLIEMGEIKKLLKKLEKESDQDVRFQILYELFM